MSKSVSGQDEDELITLEDLFRILWKRRGVVATAVLLALSCGAIYLFFKAPVYEARASLRIGHAEAGIPFEDPHMLRERLLAEYGKRPARGVVRQPPFLTTVLIERDAPSILQLTVVDKDPSGAFNLLTEIAEKVRSRHNRVFLETSRSLNESLISLRRQRASLEDQYRQIVSDNRRSGDPIESWARASERARILEAMVRIDLEVPKLIQLGNPPRLQRTELAGEIVAPTAPSHPRPLLVLPFAAAIGVVIGTMAVLLLEVIARPRR